MVDLVEENVKNLRIGYSARILSPSRIGLELHKVVLYNSVQNTASPRSEFLMEDLETLVQNTPLHLRIVTFPDGLRSFGPEYPPPTLPCPLNRTSHGGLCVVD